jgi:hypothetical protein
LDFALEGFKISFAYTGLDDWDTVRLAICLGGVGVHLDRGDRLKAGLPEPRRKTPRTSEEIQHRYRWLRARSRSQGTHGSANDMIRLGRMRI